MERPLAMQWNLWEWELDLAKLFACVPGREQRKWRRKKAMIRFATAAKTTGDLALISGAFSEAEAHYTRAINAGVGRLSPAKLSVLYGNRSAAWIGQGQYAAACGDAEAALILRPDWGQVCAAILPSSSVELACLPLRRTCQVQRRGDETAYCSGLSA